MFDAGEGPPLVVVPGLQGRWEWYEPALWELAGRCRTIAYSLAGDPGSGRAFDPALGFENHLRQLDAVFEQARIDRAAVCGLSFGGLIALQYAATRADRTSALVLVSAPGPGFTPSRQQAQWLSRPWLSAPAFVMTAPIRVWPEVRAAVRKPAGRLAFLARQAVRCAAAPMVPPLMAARMASTAGQDFHEACRHVRAPTLIVTGDDGLDRVVPVASTREYASLIRGAEYRVMTATGHLGLLTQPARFADIVGAFVHAARS